MGQLLKTLEIELPYDPAIPLLGIHTKETRIERDTCTPMFIPALFIIVRTFKQPRCPSADEWLRKLWYIYTVEYYSAIKKIIYTFKLNYCCFSLSFFIIVLYKNNFGTIEHLTLTIIHSLLRFGILKFWDFEVRRDKYSFINHICLL